MTIGARIKQRRKERGLTVVELAKQAGIAATTLYDLERGDSRSTTKLHRVAAALNCNLDWLESGKGNPAAGIVSNDPPTLYAVAIGREGVLVGAEWEKLFEPARSQIRTMIESLVAAQVRAGRKKRTVKGERDDPRADA